MIRWKPLISSVIGVVCVLPVTSCNTVLTDDYEAIAITQYTWQVEYITDPNKTQGGRLERFATTSLENRNGQMPDAAVTGPDDRGLWWPELPPRPTVDELEAEQRSQETIGTPELIKSVDYTLTYQDEGEAITRPTDYSVYRQAVKAYENDRPLELTLGLGDATVEKAESR